MNEMYDYLADEIEVKRAAPADDVLTALVQAEEDGDRLTRDELVAQLVTLYVAGHEPTTSLIGNGMLALLRQPEQLALLRSQPTCCPTRSTSCCASTARTSSSGASPCSRRSSVGGRSPPAT